MLFGWWKSHRRRNILAQPFPPGWFDFLHNNVAHYRLLSDTQQIKLRDDLRLFVAEIDWEGCGGLDMTDEVKVTVAAQACILVLGREIDLFRRVQSILVYPTGYLAPREEVVGQNIVLESASALLGQAHYRGPVILAWDEVLEGGRNPRAGHNLVFHEFAHQLDMLDGVVDGTPPLDDDKQARRWNEIMTAEYRRLRKESRSGQVTLLDPYGTTDEAEFFAVATECFFDRPVPLRQGHPGLYDLLREYYRQDPASWPNQQ